MKPVHLRLITTFTATLVSLGLAEVVARQTYGEGFTILVDPYEDHSYRPFLEYDQSWGPRAAHIFTNSLGWKDERSDVVVEKDPGRLRVVVLGDSFAEGLGYPQELTASGFAERALKGGPWPVEVLNGGRVSYSPLLEYQRLRRFLAAGYRADAVVLLYDVSDAQDELAYTRRYQFSASGEPDRFRGWNYHPVLRAAYNHSALVRSLRRLPSDLRRRAAAAPPAEAAAGLPDLHGHGATISEQRLFELPAAVYHALRPNWPMHPPSLRGWARQGLRTSIANLARIDRLASAHGIPLLIVVYPWPQMLYSRDDPALYALLAKTFPGWYEARELVCGRRPSPPVSEYQRQVRAFCRRHGIPLLDLVPEFQKSERWHELFIPGDVHWNERGNRLVGERIAEAVRQLLSAAAAGPRRDRL